MKILLLFLIIIGVSRSSCPDDEDLQRHQCICNTFDGYIQCSSLPNQCHTCIRYKAIYFDEKVQFLSAEIFASYRIFDRMKRKNSFKIQFAQLKNISSKAFAKTNVNEDRTLEIKILKYSSSIISTRLFEDITIENNARLNIEIFDATESILTIERYAYQGIKFKPQSQFRFSILSARDSIEFQPNATSLHLPSNTSMELSFSNFARIFAKKYSFASITEEQSSRLTIHFNHFQLARFSHHSFSNFHQFDQSIFHLSLSNLNHLIIEPNFFDTIIQFKSFLIISISNLTNDLCLPNRTFTHIKQQINSTWQLQINHGGNILFTSESLRNITQNSQSKFEISIIHSYDVYFSRNALKNFNQEDRSLIDIHIEYGQNLIFEDYMIESMDIDRSSQLKIAFQYSRGTLQIARNAFSNINKGYGGELLFQIINSSDFHLRLNQSTFFQRLEILDRSLSSEDLCRISNIPSHIPIKLPYDNQCSCTVYYLYHHLRQKLLPDIFRELVPECYSNMSLNQIESVENQCAFANQIYNCQQMEGEIQINIPQGICQKDVKSNHSMTSISFPSLMFVLIAFGCLIFVIICIHILYSSTFWNILSKYLNASRRQRQTTFSTESYEQLTQQEESRRQIVVKYVASSEQI